MIPDGAVTFTPTLGPASRGLSVRVGHGRLAVKIDSGRGRNSMKRGFRLVALLAAVALALVATPALADESPTYLALGDSVPFGFSPFVSPSVVVGFVVYPEDLASL